MASRPNPTAAQNIRTLKRAGVQPYRKAFEEYSPSHLQRLASNVRAGKLSGGTTKQVARGHGRTKEHPIVRIKGGGAGKRRFVRPYTKTTSGRITSLERALHDIKGAYVHLIAHGVIAWDPDSKATDPYRRQASALTTEEEESLDPAGEFAGKTLQQGNHASSVRPTFQVQDNIAATYAEYGNSAEGRVALAESDVPVFNGHWVRVDYWTVTEAAPAGVTGPVRR
jgi:hypothetical protein